jgi:hypothetical protein
MESRLQRDAVGSYLKCKCRLYTDLGKRNTIFVVQLSSAIIMLRSAELAWSS